MPEVNLFFVITAMIFRSYLTIQVTLVAGQRRIGHACDPSYL